MDNIAVEDIRNMMDDPEGGCIVQADDPQMLAVAAFDGANTGSAILGNNSWYWTSMLKLMEQGAAPSSSSTHNNNAYTGAAHFSQQAGPMAASVSTSTSSPSSSSVHDQPINDMLANSNAINANDPDNSVWGQEFLSGPIGESKTSNNMHHLACSDDGLHELLYPRTVLELLFSDQLKLEQLPSWPDILQQTAGGTSARNFGFPVVPDKIATMPSHHNVNSDNIHFDIKIPPYLHNYPHVGGLADDRLSSSTASSALSENTINHWAPPNVAAAQCEHAHAHLGTVPSMQQIDHTHVKQEYTHVPSPAYSNNENINCINDPKLLSHYMHHHQQIHLRLLADKTAGNVINDEAMINQEITAANFSHNLRQGGLDYFQHISNHAGGATVVAPVFDNSRVGPAPAASLHYISQASHQLGKKSRPLESQPARKEKLGERITTLQQLVSPFGKTDTASVLLEAIGYIKFLQDQVQALSSPYFKSPTTQSGDRNHNADEAKPDLRSRGLCLVPLSCTMQVANDNGADYWYGGAFR